MSYFDRKVVKLCLCSFLFCFSLLVFLEFRFEVDKVLVSDISFSDVNSYVRVEGKIKHQSLVVNDEFIENNYLFFDLCDETSCIKVSVFDYDRDFKLNPNLEYFVVGKVNLYDMNLSLIAREIKVLNSKVLRP